MLYWMQEKGRFTVLIFYPYWSCQWVIFWQSLMNSQQTAPCVNVTATARGWTFLTTKLSAQVFKSASIHVNQRLPQWCLKLEDVSPLLIMAPAKKAFLELKGKHSQEYHWFAPQRLPMYHTVSVCRSFVPVSSSPSSDCSIEIGAQRGGTYSSWRAAVTW